MAQLYSSTATCLAVKRLPALSLTLCLELLGAVIIDQLHQVINTFTLTVSMSRLQHKLLSQSVSTVDYQSECNVQVIKAYTLIVSFMPAISALSGNLGLQASANTIRGLGTGERSLGNISNYWRTDCSLQVTSTPLVISQT